MEFRVACDHGDELRYLDTCVNLSLPRNLNHGSRTKGCDVALACKVVSTHSVQVWIREILPNVLSVILTP